MKRLTITLIGAALFFAALGPHYALPQVSVVGVEVKRADAEQGTRDVYMIQTQLSDGGGIRVFRNEDAWLYLKFHSAALQARVTGLSREEAVAIRHYGWRIPVLAMFPNAISAWPVEAGYRHIPLSNISVIGLLFAAVFVICRAVRRASVRVSVALTRRAEERTREAASRNIPPVIDAGHEAWLLPDQPSSGRPDDPGRGA
jgi:hypothetical protein